LDLAKTELKSIDYAPELEKLREEVREDITKVF